MRFASVSSESATVAVDVDVPGSSGPGPADADLDVRWASGDSERGYVAIGGAGGLYSSGAASAGHSLEWREIVLRGAPGPLPAGSLSFAVLSPGGGLIAALTGAPGSGTADARLLIVQRTTGVTRAVALGGIVDGRPPAWIADGRVAIPIRDRLDRSVVALVDSATGSVVILPGGGGCLSVSGDGSITVSTSPASPDTVATGTTTAFLAGIAGDQVRIGNTANQVPAQVLLDRAGTHLAVAWLDDLGDTVAVAVFVRGTLGWTLAVEAPVPANATRAVLVGFDP